MNKTIKQIADELLMVNDENDSLIHEYKKDPRKGVQQLIAKWEKAQQEIQRERTRFQEMSQYEQNLYNKGISYIAGIDEVGRGPLAGPVVAAAVILPKNFFLPGLDDSKKISEQKREELFQQITSQAVTFGIGIIDAKKIDEVNIYQATKLAMKQAILKLSIKPEHLLIDAMEIQVDIPQTSIIKGDSKSYSIAAGSIIAKVTRDRLMRRVAIDYPQYGFEKHMGYGTGMHFNALNTFGVTEYHRRSYSPVQQLLEGREKNENT
ncbi:ribonuclease HII [Litchfieldia salsa]|uniref:Ribonuclease HII n=1 Tax=Litchfieldia salsa TaxID=930152 RepID=A0A1H0RAG5_9BACI|nr:ribonuclease HII [Litchfieldia salsa]SDP25938.1 RNase HII [Litchfieldia salsa]